jgi:hypothetical protein
MTRVLTLMAIVFLVLVPMAATAQQPGTSEGKVSGNYVVKESAEIGYRFVDINGNSSMYNTLENLQEGPRLLEFSLNMRSLNHTGTVFDSLSLSSFGYGGDPQAATRLRASKSKWYDFSGLYRRDQNYFDYNLLANPLNPANTVVPNNVSPHFMDTRRNMGDFNLTLAPQSPLRVRLGFARNVHEGPSGIGTSLHEGTDIGLFNNFKTRSDRYQVGVDLKVAPRTNFSFDQYYEHNKLDTEISDAPFRIFNAFNPLTPGVATPVDVGLIFDPFYNQPCADLVPGVVPAISGNTLNNLKCNVYFSYARNAFSRTSTPTSVLSFQSNYWKKLDLTAQAGYSSSEMKMPAYDEIAHALITRTNEIAFQFTGPGRAKRIEGHADLGFTYHFDDHWSFSNQFKWLNWRIPGSWASSSVSCFVPPGSTIFTSPGALPGTTACLGLPSVAAPPGVASDFTFVNFLGEASIFNTSTVEWELNKRFAAHLGYRYGNRDLTVNDAVAVGIVDPTQAPDFNTSSEQITEHTVLVGFHSMPIDGWRVNADLENTQNSNQFTRISPRRLIRFKMRSSYQLSSWMSLSGTINDVEGKSDPENLWPVIYTPPRHSDHYRDYSLGFTINPKDWIAVDFGYNYNDLYSTTPSCLPMSAGRTPLGPAGAPLALAPCFNPDGATVNNNTSPLVLKYKEDVNSGYINVMVKPVKRVTLNLGYDLTSNSGFSNWFRGDNPAFQFLVPVDALGNVTNLPTTLFLPGPNPRAPLGTLGINWHKPSGSVAVEIYKGLIAKGAFNYFGYNEKSFAGPVVPRDFHAKTGTVSLRYEF